MELFSFEGLLQYHTKVAQTNIDCLQDIMKTFQNKNTQPKYVKWRWVTAEFGHALQTDYKTYQNYNEGPEYSGVGVEC